VNADQFECWDLARWNAATARTFDDVTVEAPPTGFHARLACRRWEGVQLAKIEAPGARIRGGRRPARPAWHLLYNESGRCALRQCGRQVELAGGELSLVKADQPFELEFEQRHRMTVLTLPADRTTVALNGHWAARHGAGESILVAALLAGLLNVAEEQAARVSGAELQDAALNLLQRMPPPCGDRRAVHVARLRALVEHEAARPDLDAALMARELGASVRYVQGLFAAQGTTPSAAILERRLQLAATRLRALPDEPVLAVAMACGFGDLSHFCRSFKRRYGCSAGHWRRQLR